LHDLLHSEFKGVTHGRVRHAAHHFKKKNSFRAQEYVFKTIFDPNCNIPPVSIGIISVKGPPESNVHETHYGEECFTTQCQLNPS